MRRSHCLTLLAAAALLLPIEARAQQLTINRGPSLPHNTPAARIAESSARTAALSRIPQGNVAAVDLKAEHGTLIYFYDIAIPGKEGLEEVQVSAVDGQVISQRHLGPTAPR